MCRAQAPQLPGQGRGCILSASPQSPCLLPTHTHAGSHASGQGFIVETDPAQRQRHRTTELTQRVNWNEAPAGTVVLAYLKATHRDLILLSC